MRVNTVYARILVEICGKLLETECYFQIFTVAVVDFRKW